MEGFIAETLYEQSKRKKTASSTKNNRTGTRYPTIRRNYHVSDLRSGILDVSRAGNIHFPANSCHQYLCRHLPDPTKPWCGTKSQQTRWLLYCQSILATFFGFRYVAFLFEWQCRQHQQCFFETISGFTTTGATIMDNIDAQSHGILFWRSLTQWIGGLGIVCFAIAILPIFNEGNVQLFQPKQQGSPNINFIPKSASW